MNPAQSKQLLALAAGAVGGILACTQPWKKEVNKKDSRLEPATDAPDSKMPPPMAMNVEANDNKLAPDQEKKI